jgi:hypothetical protein
LEKVKLGQNQAKRQEFRSSNRGLTPPEKAAKPCPGPFSHKGAELEILPAQLFRGGHGQVNSNTVKAGGGISNIMAEKN